jgi:hypothetical protein
VLFESGQIDVDRKILSLWPHVQCGASSVAEPKGRRKALACRVYLVGDFIALKGINVQAALDVCF